MLSNRSCLLTIRMLAPLLIAIVLGCSKSQPQVDSRYTVMKLSEREASCELPSDFYQLPTVLKHQFRVMNDTNSPVRIDRIKSSCSCTSAELVSRELASGEDTLLHMAIVLQKNGTQRAICTLIDDSDRVWVLKIRVTSYARLGFGEPALRRDPSYVSFGMLDPGEGATRTVNVYTCSEPDRQPPKLELIDIPAEPVRVLSKDCGIVTSSDGFHKRITMLTFDLSEQRVPGVHETKITIGCNTAGEFNARDVILAWRVRSLYRVRPERIYLGYIDDLPQKVEREVVVERVDGEPLIITAVRASHPIIEVMAPTLISAAKKQVLLTVDLTHIAGTFLGEVVIETNHV